MPLGNSYGIFKSKRARNLAIYYGLEMANKNAYVSLAGESTHKHITYEDVKFITENFWLDHFVHHAPEPIKLENEEYMRMYFYLKNKYNLFD